MKLRGRLALVLGLGVVPLAVGAAFVSVALRRAAVENAAAEIALARLEDDRDRCEATPETWPLPRRGRLRRALGLGIDGPRGRRGQRLHAYDASFESRNPEAPPFPPALREALETGDDVASMFDDRQVVVAVRMPWAEGPCAIAVVRRNTIGEPFRWSEALGLPLLVSVLAAGIAIVAAGPTVRRIRRLTAAVRTGAAAGQPVEARGSDEIAELGRAINDDRARIREHVATLERRDTALREYVANTTHDVLLPVSVLSGHLTAVRAAADAGHAPDREVVAGAMSEIEYLTNLVHNLSVAAKLDVGAPLVERHPLDLGTLVERVVARHTPVARQLSIALEHAIPETPLRVRADVTLVEQAIGNLVHNAVRHNRAGGHVAVVLDRSASGFVLSVMDDGPGMTDEELARALERGYRGEEARRRHPRGLGLGLAICRSVVDLHGWTLTLARRPEGGLEVVVRGSIDPS